MSGFGFWGVGCGALRFEDDAGFCDGRSDGRNQVQASRLWS